MDTWNPEPLLSLPAALGILYVGLIIGYGVIKLMEGDEE